MVRRHKPKTHRATFVYPLKHRLMVAAIGVCMTLSGIYKFTYGPFIGENWLHQSVHSPSLIGIGAAVALSALIPASWINRATGWRCFHL